MERLDNYKGREQAYIKHRLLETYLKALFMIVGQWSQAICYVDCFSGPWQESSTDLGDTSIGISLRIMEDCQQTLKKMNKDVRFRALYIEKDPASYKKLQEYLMGNKSRGIECSSANGSFYDLREGILDWCGPEDFAFFFIDPKGWKDVVEPATLAPLLRREKSEFLINFMYSFIIRALPQKQFENQMSAIFGNIPETNGMVTCDKEKYLFRIYRNRLKEIMDKNGKVPRFAYTSILDIQKEKTKYELIYITRHPLGIVKFIQSSEKLDLVQRRVRQITRIDKTGQGELFCALDNESINCFNTIDDVKSYWMKKLKTNLQYFGVEQLADMHEETGWLEKDFQDAFKKLLDDGKVENVKIVNSRRKSKFVRFEEHRGQGEPLRRVE